MVFGFEGGEESVEFFFAFVGENGVLSGEAVGDGVVADGGASFRCLRAGAVLSVAAISFELTVGDHKEFGMVYVQPHGIGRGARTGGV